MFGKLSVDTERFSRNFWISVIMSISWVVQDKKVLFFYSVCFCRPNYFFSGSPMRVFGHPVKTKFIPPWRGRPKISTFGSNLAEQSWDVDAHLDLPNVICFSLNLRFITRYLVTNYFFGKRVSVNFSLCMFFLAKTFCRSEIFNLEVNVSSLVSTLIT